MLLHKLKVLKMASKKVLPKLPTVAVLTRHTSQLLKSVLGMPVDRGFEEEWKHQMGHVPYRIVDHRQPPEETLSMLQEAEVILADPDLIGPMFSKLPNARWVQGTWAGIDSMVKTIDPSAIPPPFVYTRLGGGLCTSMAEFVVGHMIAHERQFGLKQKAQEQKDWSFANYRTLEQLTLGIVGLGDIGEEIARICKAFGMKTWGLGRRTLAPENISKHVDHYRPLSGLAELLANCDYVCSVLPQTPATDDLLSGEVLSSCTKRPVFINIGRGNVISEEAVLNALDKGWISHAILDVFQTEPLPESSPLWSSPKVTVSPHVAAVTYAFKIIEIMADNYNRYVNGEPLKYAVNWDIGY